ncbi:Arylacetonitrilase [Tolypocladium paradoxum]|uniref:nitrilase n=1 Tax=Tolypocladium paradoxum TaxID=94208 RepID=A0A2S4KSG3_9HYPO|nr:Arylacetonitrilase [Tolypocladium paradoxum]
MARFSLTRRKIKATHMERTIFGEPSADVVDTPVARIGALSCWEHLQPLLKYHTYNQREQIHVAAWPPLFKHGGVPDLWSMASEELTFDDITGGQALARVYAIESGSFVLHATAVISQSSVDFLKTAGNPFGTPGGGSSAIFGPDGRKISTDLPETEEGLVYATLDMHEIHKVKGFVDVCGHYSRPDVLWLGVDDVKKTHERLSKDTVEHGVGLEAFGDQTPAFSDLGHSDGGISSSDASAVNDVSSMMWRMTIRDDGETSFTGPSGNFCFPTVRHDIVSTTNSTEKVPPTINIYETTKPTVNQSSREHLFDLFSRSINQTHQFVDSFTIELLKIQTPSNMELLECAILAAGTVLSNTSESRILEDGHSSYARTIALHQCSRNPDVYTVQALGILFWRELALDEENMAWMYLECHYGVPSDTFQHHIGKWPLFLARDGNRTYPPRPNTNQHPCYPCQIF